MIQLCYGLMRARPQIYGGQSLRTLKYLALFPIFVVFGSSTSCQTRTFHAETKDDGKSTSGNPSLKNYGGPFNFGIKFDQVDEPVATDFWTSWSKEGTYSKRALKSARGTRGRFTKSEYFDFEAVSFPKAEDEVRMLMSQYVGRTKEWHKLSCVHVDMDAYVRGEKKLLPLKSEQDGCLLNEQGSGNQPDPAATASAVDAWSNLDLPAAGPLTEEADLSLDEKSRIPLFGVGALSSRFDGENKRVGLGVAYQLAGNAGGKPVFASPTFAVIIVGDYIVPTQTWATSKVFAMPVMKFDSNPSSPTYLQPIAWYDLGLLYLNRLPAEGNVLTSRIGNSLAELWRDPESRSKVGNLMHRLPAERVNGFLKKEEVAPPLVTDPMMERVPVGSVHFIANSFWNQRSRGLEHLVVLQGISRKQLVDLYLAGGNKGQIWVNSLDNTDFGSSMSGPSNEAFKAFASAGDCAAARSFNGITPGVFYETELIVGLEAGRRLMLENKSVKVFSCPTFANKD